MDGEGAVKGHAEKKGEREGAGRTEAGKNEKTS